MPQSDCGGIFSSWCSFLSSDILACNERSFHLSRCLKEWDQLYYRSDHHPLGIASQRIIGILIIILGCGSLGFVAFLIDKDRREDKSYIVPMIFFGLAGVLFLFHGLCFACTGTLWPFSARLDSCAEDIRVLSIVIPELELIHI